MNVPVISRLCDRKECYKSASQSVHKNGREYLLCKEHTKSPEVLKQKALWENK